MKKIAMLAVMLGLVGLGVQGQSRLNGQDKSAVFRQPWEMAAPKKADGIAGLWAQTGGRLDAAAAPQAVSPDVNKDIEITADLGPWLICVSAFRGEKGHVLVRKMVQELREKYKLPAYAYNYVADEKRKEQERIRAVVEKQREFLAKNGLTVDSPIRVKTIKIEDNWGAFLGGYKDDESAHRALQALRKIEQNHFSPDVLEYRYYGATDEKTNAIIQKDGVGDVVWVNPFHRAFACRNPLVKREQQEVEKLDIAALRAMNSDEPFSLLKCPKAYTLVIKAFQTPTTVHQRGDSKNDLMGKIGLDKFGLGKAPRIDVAAENAHNLTEALRKTQLEAYVLHTKYYSVVSVGGFDGLEDPNLIATQNMLQAKLKLEAVELFPRPLPMAVPR